MFQNHPAFVGFDRLFSELNQFAETAKKAATYPPFNIKKVDENKYEIEMAVAGFGNSQVSVEVEGDTLKVKGEVNQNKDGSEYIYKGIAERGFERSFKLADNVVVQNATLINGMLKISLDALVQQSKTLKIFVDDGSGPKQTAAK